MPAWLDKLIGKAKDPAMQQKVKDAVAKKQQGGGMSGTPQGGTRMGGQYAAGTSAGYYGGQYVGDSDGDGIPDNQDANPYGGPEDYTGSGQDDDQYDVDTGQQQGDVEYVDESGAPISADEVENSGGEFEPVEPDSPPEYEDNSQDMGYGDPVQPDEVQDYEAPTDYGTDYGDTGGDTDYGDTGGGDSGGGDSGGGE